MAPDESPAQANSARLPPEGGAVVLTLQGRMSPDQIGDLCDRARALLAGNDAEIMICDVDGLTQPDGVAVDALARLQLTVLRLGRRLYVRAATTDLTELIALMGLKDVLPLSEELSRSFD